MIVDPLDLKEWPMLLLADKSHGFCSYWLQVSAPRFSYWLKIVLLVALIG
jgi:hypothetical protein